MGKILDEPKFPVVDATPGFSKTGGFNSQPSSIAQGEAVPVLPSQRRGALPLPPPPLCRQALRLPLYDCIAVVRTPCCSGKL